jgi:hypothetical protein
MWTGDGGFAVFPSRDASDAGARHYPTIRDIRSDPRFQVVLRVMDARPASRNAPPQFSVRRTFELASVNWWESKCRNHGAGGPRLEASAMGNVEWINGYGDRFGPTCG